MTEPGAVTPSKRDLPPEIWKKILFNLDEIDLLTCRLVNQRWKDLADEVLREMSSLWKHSFDWVNKSTSGRRATRFSEPYEITWFMEEMEGATNPFANGTVGFTPYMELTEDERAAFQDNFCKLLDTFKDSIFVLNYSTTKVPKEMALNRMFCSILNLTSLRTLVFNGFFEDWDYLEFLRSVRSRKLFKDMVESAKLTLPENLTDVHIYGLSGFIPLFYMFEVGGFESILKSVSSLELSSNSGHHLTLPEELDDCLDYPFCQFPNLKKLKVRFPSPSFLKQFQQFQPNCRASLKEVSLHFYERQPPTRVSDLKETFALLDFHAETLELLHLQFGFFHHYAMDTTGLYAPVKYAKLKTLVIRYDDIDYWPIAFSELMEKLVNLQQLKLLLPIRQPYNVQNSPKEQYRKVEACWNLVPATVRIIIVPDYGWKIKRGETLQFNEDGEVLEME